LDLAVTSVIGSAGADRVAQLMASGGLFVDYGLASLRLHARSPSLADALHAVYRHFPLQAAAAGAWADIDLSVVPHGRRRLSGQAPEVRLASDGRLIFDPFPADHGLPLVEWGCNWMVAQRMNHVLLLHAGAVERDGTALLLPALPGSGKSTLTAALALSGWRLLSDEFGALDPASFSLQPVLKPVGLKNASIDVIRTRFAGAELGPSFPKTHKGTVAHLAPPAAAVARRHEGARPGAIVLPRWQAGVATRFERLGAHEAFSALAFNSFNYAVLGETGFRAVLRVVRECPAWRLVYSDLDDALATLGRLWQDLPGMQRAAPAQD